MNDYLSERLAELNSYKKLIEKRLANLKYKGVPEYHVHVFAKNNQILLRPVNGKEIYLKSDKRYLASQVATYEYLEKTLKLVESELSRLEKIRKINALSPENYYETLSKGRQKLIKPIRLTDEQYTEAWLAESFEPKAFKEEDDSRFYTDKNERVRSKSEIIIANTLSKFKVPYRYECPLYLEGMGVIHPDFSALNVKRRKICYWEHLGRMDDPDYANKNVRKINSYQKNGICLGDRLIITMETSNTPLNIKLLEMLINNYLIN